MKKSYSITRTPLTPFRKLIIDGLDVGMKKHYIKGYVEFDITKSRQSIRTYRRQSKNRLSFTAFFIAGVVQALQENKSLNAGLYKNNIVVFDDIDVSLAIEMSLNGEMVPRLFVIRSAHKMTVQEIQNEIEAAQKQIREQGDLQGGEKNKAAMLVLKLPKCIRKMVWNRLLRDPFFTRRMMGTVGITAVGMFGALSGWAEPIPTSNHTVSFALGSVTRKPREIKGAIIMRDILHVTIMFDHDVVDGAPAARFAERLRELVENGLDGFKKQNAPGTGT
ncbi:2-oxo acid dehydrogenase subunit E2 [candidate division KSB1 bacterium]|nr:2-oxo acid dehydrogenase subunit E2 [candidate division KSB1 bacterium]RQW10735.1 MAG: hypothetical protein EH222_01925 [candidate division KSB1 bacterium]